MRVLVFFDLPTHDLEDMRSYRKFRKFLLKRGFMMLQESVYCKLTLNQTAAKAVVSAIKSNKPEEGLVQVLVITEKQYSRMEYICGDKQTSFLDSDEKLVIL